MLVLKSKMKLPLVIFVVVLFGACGPGQEKMPANARVIRAVNHDEVQKGERIYALVGATLIDGTGGAPLLNSCVIVRNDVIESVGKREDITIPPGAEIIELGDLTLLPGLIDAHYHDEDSDTLTTLYLRNGVTSVRDPGEWIEAYDGLRASGKALPRLFLSGPHLDKNPPAYPRDARIVRDAEEAGLAVDELAAQGVTVIKAYYGLSVGMIREVCERAKKHGIPVTAHLEVTNAMDAINAGVDGIEHITTFGAVLAPARDVEVYKQKVLADKNARRWGRYEMWSSLDLDDNAVVDSLLTFLVEKKTFVTPTLAIFEQRADRADSIAVRGFENMVKLVGMARERGVRIVVGSHSYVPYADLGFAFQREMEMLKEAGLSNMEVIIAATSENARFFRIDSYLGTVQSGKLADLIAVEGDPLTDITAMRNVRKVMLNGVWVKE